MIEIIPAIDLIEGKCVRLTQGDYSSKKTYNNNPLDVAKRYEDIGIRRLHLVDLDGAKQSFPQNLNVLETIAKNTTLDIQYGGGIKSTESATAVFNSGAHRIICGSIAVTDPELFKQWLKTYSPEKVILGADVKDGKIATHGWLKSAELSVQEMLTAFLSFGLSQVICTDISKDGMLSGPAFDLYHALQTDFPGLQFTASGGIKDFQDILHLDEMRIPSVVVGKAIYEGFIQLNEISDYINQK